jgi:hypothetical protein
VLCFDEAPFDLPPFALASPSPPIVAQLFRLSLRAMQIRGGEPDQSEDVHQAGRTYVPPLSMPCLILVVVDGFAARNRSRVQVAALEPQQFSAVSWLDIGAQVNTTIRLQPTLSC